MNPNLMSFLFYCKTTKTFCNIQAVSLYCHSFNELGKVCVYYKDKNVICKNYNSAAFVY